MKKYVALVLTGAFLLSGCGDAAMKVPAIEKTTGQFSDEAEAVYDERFKTMVAAFENGAATTVYDTFADIASAAEYKPLAAMSAPEALNNALATADDYIAKRNSLAFIVMHKGKVINEVYYKDATRETLINSKSLAKPMGVIAVGRAIEKGYIKSLDQPVADIVIEWQGTPKEKILIRHLLDMRSGLLEQGWAPESTNVLNRAYLHPYHDEVIVHEYPLKHEPGVRYDYSNANSELVSLVIKRATGVKYETWVENEVIKPLGAMGGTVWVNREGGTAHSGCCMQLPAETWLRLAMLVMQDGEWEGKRLLPEGYTAQMKTTTPQNIYVGMGVYSGAQYLEQRGAANLDVKFGTTYHSAPYIDKDLTLFDGNSNQVVYMVPSKDLIVLRVGDHPPKDKPWDNAYLPNLISGALKAQ